MSKKTKRPYQQCKRCIMDTDASGITFTDNGFCNYCTEFIERSKNILGNNLISKEKKLEQLVDKIKADGKGKPYDCIVGVSGGVDSSWVLVQTKKLGLRPLAVHMDNGWNSELAQNNISNLLRSLNIDLYTHVIDWEEYRELMQAFFNADVIDVELLYDNALAAVNYSLATKYNLKFILAGTNNSTEGMKIPKEWVWFKYDKRNIKSIARRYGIRSFKTFPTIGTFKFIWYHFIKGICWTSLLDYLEYNKFRALDQLEKSYGFKRYPYKHYESVFTRFYQGYILPKKFKVDKRKIHLSNLVVTKQISRNEAIEDLKSKSYISDQESDVDIKYFLKKMKWSNDQLEIYLSRPEIMHSDYPSEKFLWENLLALYKFFIKKK